MFSLHSPKGVTMASIYGKYGDINKDTKNSLFILGKLRIEIPITEFAQKQIRSAYMKLYKDALLINPALGLDGVTDAMNSLADEAYMKDDLSLRERQQVTYRIIYLSRVEPKDR
jgi:hypothetical protein